MLVTGDKVRYVPEVCHAFEKDGAGNYPWAIGKLEWQSKGDGTREQVPVEITDGKQLDTFMASARRSGNRNKPVPMRPVATWPAIVRKVSEDGKTAHIDVTSPRGGVTLHYDNVPVVAGGGTLAPHTCYPEE